MLVIDAAVTNVETLSSLEEYLAGLGRKHRTVGVKLSSFSVGRGIFLPLNPFLGPPALAPTPQTQLEVSNYNQLCDLAWPCISFFCYDLP